MPRQIKSYPELEAFRHLLGKEPDHVVAEKAGTSTSIVGRFRRKFGIPAYDGYKFGIRPTSTVSPPGESNTVRGKRGPDRAPRRSKLNPWRALIGVQSDDEVAQRAGVTREAVRLYRRRHNIADPPHPVLSANSPNRAYLVEPQGGAEKVLIATDIVSAALQAQRVFRSMTPPATVIRVTELGPAIA